MCRSTSRREFLRAAGSGAAARVSRARRAAGRGRLHASRSICRRGPRACRASGFFPGSTIGNFEPHEAAAFLRHAGRILGPRRDASSSASIWSRTPQVLQRAYNDAAGRDRAFNLNLLARINRELGGKFDLALRASRLLQPRALAHRDASGQPEAPARQGLRRMHRVPRRRNHPHREQLQVLGRVVRRAGARRRLDAGRGVDRRRTIISASTR